MKARRKARTGGADVKLRRRQAKLDVKIARGKRSIKALTKRLKKAVGIQGRRAKARKRPPRHIGDRLKRVFFKNALYELVARRK